VTEPGLRLAKATHYCWLSPGELLEDDDDSSAAFAEAAAAEGPANKPGGRGLGARPQPQQAAPRHGAFVFLFHDPAITEPGAHADVIFPVWESGGGAESGGINASGGGGGGGGGCGGGVGSRAGSGAKRFARAVSFHDTGGDTRERGCEPPRQRF